MKSANTITAEQYDAGHSLEGVTAIDFGPVSAEDAKALAERMANKLPVVRPATSEGIWHPLMDWYTDGQLPDSFDYYCLLDGDNGPMLGNIYEDRQNHLQYVIKVSTPSGLIDAALLKCKLICFVRWSTAEVAVTAQDA